MNKQLSDDEIRRQTFGRFKKKDDADNEKAVEHTKKQTYQETAQTTLEAPAPNEHGEKKINMGWFRKKKKEPDSPKLWTGQTTVADILAPSSVNLESRDYIVVDGVYHAYLYVAGYGYQTRNAPAWLGALVEAGENIGISFSFQRMERSRILNRIAKKTMFNRSRMREVEDTRSDYEELDSAINFDIDVVSGCN